MRNLLLRLVSPAGSDGVGQVLRGSGIAFAIKGVGVGLAFVAQVLLARWLGTSGYGEYVVVIAWANLAVLLGKVGQDNAALRFVSAYHAASDLHSLHTFGRFSALLVLFGGLATGAMLAIWSADWTLGLRLAVACLVPVTCLLHLRTAGLRALGELASALLPQEILVPLGTVVVAACLQIGRGQLDVYQVVVGTAIVTAMLVAYTQIRARRRIGYRLDHRPASGQDNWRTWLLTGLPLMSTASFHLIMTRADLIMVDRILGATDAGIYGAVSRTGMFVGFGALAVFTMVTPMLARYHVRGSGAELRRVLTVACWAVLATGIPVAAVMVAFAPLVLSLFGAEFQGGADTLRIFAGGQVM